MNLDTLLSQNNLLGSLLLGLLQFLAAIPWLYVLDPQLFRGSWNVRGTLIGSAIGFCVFIDMFLAYKADSDSMQLYGRFYAAALHLQLLIDIFLYGPHLITWIWPKGGAVALSAFREGWRQPMFWLIAIFGGLATWVAVVLPYFTFGDDFKMMKQIGFDVVMLCALLFGTLSTSISISEEIEGRTAITVMSKPISRRQFLLGKYLGVIMTCALMAAVLMVNLNFALLVNPEFDPINKDRAFDPMPSQAKDLIVPAVQKYMPQGSSSVFASGAAMWFGECFAHTFGIVLVFGQVMVLVAIATALATRMIFVLNLVIVLFVYLLGHLAPVIVKATDASGGGQSTAQGLINFLAKMFSAFLPSLEFYTMGPAIIRETPIDLWKFGIYVATAGGYTILYTAIALIIGLLLFEDRDLA